MQKIYKELWADNFPKILNGNIKTDPMLDSNDDFRRGLTLRFRPPSHILENIQSFLTEAQNKAPNQYFYPRSDIHLTILSIISCYPFFDLNSIQVSDYQNVIEDVLDSVESFDLTFDGITTSSSSILIQGFDKDENLNNWRNDLRIAFKNSKLENSIDTRYTLKTAHLTVIRFRKELKNKAAFASFLERNHNTNFGTCKIEKVELVYNDWYQRKERTQILETYFL